MTREDYITLAGDESAAIDFENSVLSIGREFLPPEAQSVLGGGEATASYWAWLSEQWIGCDE